MRRAVWRVTCFMSDTYLGGILKLGLRVARDVDPELTEVTR